MSRLRILITKSSKIPDSSFGCTNYTRDQFLPNCRPNSCSNCAMQRGTLPEICYHLEEILRVQTD